MKQLIKTLDVAALRQDLYIEKETKYKTMLGSLLNIIIIVISIIFFCIFGRDLVERKNPLASVSREYVDYPEFDFNKIFLRFETGPNKPLTDVFKKIYPVLTIVARVNNTINLSNVEFVDCENVSWFKENYMNVKKVIETDKQHFCLPDSFNKTIKGKRNTPYATEFEVSIKHCSQNKNAQECFNMTYISQLHKSIVMAFYYPDSYIDVNDYINPIKNYWYNDLIGMNTKAYGISQIILRAVDFISDINLIFTESSLNQTYQTYLTSYYISEASTDGYGKIFINFSNIKEVYKRRYLKVQDALANTGGFIKILSMFTLFAYKYIMSPFMLEHYLKTFLKKLDKINFDKLESNVISILK